MLFRRVSENLKSQNWFAIWLDLVVVVLGIFLAFQVDRWYETKRLESSLVERLGALAEDFEGNRRFVETAIARQTMAESAARELLALDEGDLDRYPRAPRHRRPQDLRSLILRRCPDR